MWSEIAGLLEPAWKLLTKARRVFLLWRFKKISKKSPLDADEAKEIAYATLGGRVEGAMSYRNVDSDKIFIAVHHTSPQIPVTSQVVIIEQVGQAYRVHWKSEQLFSNLHFEVVDFDEDGFHEVVIQTSDWGTGAHTFFLVVHSHRYNNTYTISEFVNRQNLAGPILPEITIQPLPPTEFCRCLETFALGRGFLQAPPKIEWDNPKFAIQRWHRDNGANPNGEVHVVFYDGNLPKGITDAQSIVGVDMENEPFSSSIIGSLDDGDIHWLAYFKNPLVGYVKRTHKWFIAYSPANFYDWATSLAHDGKRLWFGVHCVNAIYSFEFQTMQLLRHKSIAGIKFEMDSSVQYRNRRLIVGGVNSFTQDQIDEACLEYRSVSR